MSTETLGVVKPGLTTEPVSNRYRLLLQKQVKGVAMNEVEQVKHERQKIYGPPKENHEGIAQGWAPLLQPWWREIKMGRPVPPHVAALLMIVVKTNRCRRVPHPDNYVDIRAYLDFVEEWQKDAPLPLSVTDNE
jgi:hypothetical protein